MIWNPQYECQDIGERRLLQLARLKNLVETLNSRVEFYRKKFADAGVSPRDIGSLEDIAKFPFTVKDDLRVTYPYGLLACPHAEIEEIHMSSGTTGVPVVDAYTRFDVECWEEGMARTLSGAGATRHDTVQSAYGYGLFTGGLGVHYGAKRIGANIIPMSSGNTQKQLMVMRDFGTTIIGCTPSYALFMAESLPPGVTWSIFGVAATQFPMAMMGVLLGGHVRVGFEDNLYLRKGQLAKSNAELVRHTAGLIRSLDREVATVEEARKILALPAR